MSDGQVEYIPFQDPRLGRHIRHDPRSRNYPLRRTTVPTTDTWHYRIGDKLDQGNIGACTGYTAAHCLNHSPLRKHFYNQRRPPFTSEQALLFYGDATRFDPWPGEYPPTDTGSSGLAVCEAMMHQGFTQGYEWAFGFQHGLETIGQAPLMQGSYWYSDMFNPDDQGLVRPTGYIAGGHEYLWIGVLIHSDTNPSQNWSVFLNSWGPTWGKYGHFFMTWDDHAALLEQDGDLIRPTVG